MKTQRHTARARTLRIALGGIAMVSATWLRANPVIDDDVESWFKTNGTQAIPFRYILGMAENYTRTFNSGLLWPDGNNVWNIVTVQNGAQVTAIGGYHSLGVYDQTDNNLLEITGASTKMTMEATSGATTLRISGRQRNHVRVEKGAALEVKGSVEVGRGTDSQYCQLIVDDATLTLGRFGNVGNSLFVGSRSNTTREMNFENAAVVRNGGVVQFADPLSRGDVHVGVRGYDNLLHISGAASCFIVPHNVILGSSEPIGNGAGDRSKIRLEDRGLLKLLMSTNPTWGTPTGIVYNNSVYPNNVLQFNQGFLAWKGNRTTALDAYLDANVQLWTGKEWVFATTANRSSYRWKVNYYAEGPDGEAAAKAATGYDDLGGYTVFTGGPIPFTLITLR